MPRNVRQEWGSNKAGSTTKGKCNTMKGIDRSAQHQRPEPLSGRNPLCT
jgi:hypothetical protein